jgi:hypothetical protein
MLRLAISWVPVLFALLPVGSASAATIQYATRAAWEAEVGSFVTEDFESVPAQAVPQAGGTIATPWFDIVIPGNHGGIGTSGHAFSGDVHSCDFPASSCDGPGVPGGQPEHNSFVFQMPVTAFALDATYDSDIGEPGDPDIVTLQLFIAGQFFDLPAQGFLGIRSDVPFTLVAVRGDTAIFYEFDNISFSPVPEPSTAAMLAAGLAVFAARRGSVRPR